MKLAMLVYQAGIANVFEVESLNLADYGRDARRLLQSDFRTCESFALGLKAAGVVVRAACCNQAGDIARAKWSDDLEAAPFSDSFRASAFEPFAAPVTSVDGGGSLKP